MLLAVENSRYTIISCGTISGCCVYEIWILFSLCTYIYYVSLQVLSCDPSKNRLTLTLKKSLVNTELPLITEMEQMKPGMEAEGFIVNIKDKGVLVAFYNNVKVSFGIMSFTNLCNCYIWPG